VALEPVALQPGSMTPMQASCCCAMHVHAEPAHSVCRSWSTAVGASFRGRASMTSPSCSGSWRNTQVGVARIHTGGPITHVATCSKPIRRRSLHRPHIVASHCILWQACSLFSAADATLRPCPSPVLTAAPQMCTPAVSAISCATHPTHTLGGPPPAVWDERVGDTWSLGFAAHIARVGA
jgi:hypothetical protein